MKKFNGINFLAFGFGLGYAKKAPGTFGTLAGIPFILFFQQTSIETYLLATLIMAVFGVWLCGVSARQIGVHDHPGIVWDEIVGYMITMIAVPAGWQWMLLGFLLFRFFDILKPWPISYIDKHIHGGFGIMFDDVVAGIMAAGVLQLILYYVI